MTMQEANTFHNWLRNCDVKKLVSLFLFSGVLDFKAKTIWGYEWTKVNKWRCLKNVVSCRE